MRYSTLYAIYNPNNGSILALFKEYLQILQYCQTHNLDAKEIRRVEAAITETSL